MDRMVCLIDETIPFSLTLARTPFAASLPVPPPARRRGFDSSREMMSGFDTVSVSILDSLECPLSSSLLFRIRPDQRASDKLSSGLLVRSVSPAGALSATLHSMQTIVNQQSFSSAKIKILKIVHTTTCSENAPLCKMLESLRSQNQGRTNDAANCNENAEQHRL